MSESNESTSRELPDLIEDWQGKSAFACVQMLNTLKFLRDNDLVKCSCEPTPHPNEGHPVHDTKCQVWQLGFLIHGWEDRYRPADAEIWHRVNETIKAMQKSRRKGTAIGYTAVEEKHVDELFQIAEGHPIQPTDIHAAMETLRGVAASMKSELNLVIGPMPKHEKARMQGRREAIKRYFRDIDEIANTDKTNVCAGLVVAFSAWLSTREQVIPVGSSADAAPLAELANQFIDQQHLRWAPGEE